MIVPMKKVSLLVLDKYRQESLIDLRRLGLLHIKYVKSPVSPDIDSLERKIEDTEKALLVISKYPLLDQVAANILQRSQIPTIFINGKKTQLITQAALTKKVEVGTLITHSKK